MQPITTLTRALFLAALMCSSLAQGASLAKVLKLSVTSQAAVGGDNFTLIFGGMDEAAANHYEGLEDGSKLYAYCVRSNAQGEWTFFRACGDLQKIDDFSAKIANYPEVIGTPDATLTGDMAQPESVSLFVSDVDPYSFDQKSPITAKTQVDTVTKAGKPFHAYGPIARP